MSHEESISLEETNKIRISLGLKPLTDDKAPADDKEKQAEDNFAKKQEEERKSKELKRIQDGIAKVRNKRELHASLKGTTLGQADDEVDDTLKWIKRAKKREKELVKKRQEELENMDKQFQEEYTEKDLAGLKVSHDFEGLNEGEDRILTLKDSRILDNEEDELQNVELAEDERTKERNDLKIKKRDYTGYDDDEFVAGNEGMKRAVLAKYDEDIDGAKETGFRLGSGSSLPKPTPMAVKKEVAAAVNKSLLSIDYAKNLEMMDYLQEGDVGFKKPKTKKKRQSRRNGVDSELGLTEADPTQMEVDEKPATSRVRDLDSNFIDDDELQASLARSRRAKIHKPKKITSEELAKKVAEERAHEEANITLDAIKLEDAEDGDDTEPGLTFDDTSEFVRAIAYNPVVVKTEPRDIRASREASIQRAASVDDTMDGVDQAIEELEAGEVVVKEEGEDDDEAMLDAIEAAIKSTEAEEQEDIAVGTSSEQTFSTGMASTLTILRQQGILATPSADQKEREKIQLQRDLWLADQRHRIAQRELDRLKSRGSNKEQALREYENRQREQQEARDNLEMFKNYRPDVNIVYHDEFGRELTPKEAWKALSHRFHGKGSGKAKLEKRLKKIAEEKKKEAMVSGDTPLSMNRAFQLRQEKAGQAHFVLSVGNRGAVPQAAEFLDAQPLSKGKTEKNKNKKKGADKAATPQVIDMTGFTALPHATPLSSNDSPLPSSGVISALPMLNEGSLTSPAMMKSSFSRVMSESEAPSSTGGTPVPADRTKLSFSIGTKRKAVEETNGSRPPKRR